MSKSEGSGGLPTRKAGELRDKYANPLQAVARRATRMLLLKPYVWRLLRVQVHGVENLEDCPDTFVVVGNHSSHFDTPLIYGSLPPRMARYLSAGAAADYWFRDWGRSTVASHFFNAFPVERSRKPSEKKKEAPDPKRDEKARSHRGLAAALLSDGVPILLFPEGGRSYTGAMGVFTPGAAGLAISRNVPVVPVAIVGAFAAWPPHQKHLPKGRPPVHVVYGHPMRPNPGEITYRFNERIRRKIIELHDTTARAYGMKTLAEYARMVAIEKSRTQNKETP
ncbi:1-acyl-sn-glycerol-3-phosphate acyltransferase [Aestuariimicrobium sp. p3-SID1156]|uniref:lysophospholipid acyltransferase family protein n=1 Tax=Aestuariimicrobium sp. p3-SID1156 TaxID=2916038 RepID=UPI00223BD79E|nr:lysophospholipid acyltransferase family protein [Aestuariimicrobium sp. p3-SID1156]MCT1457982.1 1-acyl-sn-glycerol-3-phosphate acyltransferase [Aestuariimicrobium sp. p3-SID1156]